MQVQDIAILQDINVVSVQLKFFGGNATLTAEDLGVDTSKLPAEVVALGTKKIINKDLLSGFKSTRKAIQRKGVIKGTSFLGGYAFSPEAAKEYLDEIKPLIEGLDEEVEKFLADYPKFVDAWAKAHPAFEKAIRDAAPSVQSVRNRFSTKIRSFKVAKPSEELGDGGLAEEVSGLAGQILSEIAKDVKSTWKDRGYGAQQIKSLLKRISDKAKGLSFISSDLNKITKLVTDTLVALPATGKIEGTEYLQLKGLMDLLQDPALVMSQMTQGDLEIIEDTQVDPALIAAPSMDTDSIDVSVGIDSSTEDFDDLPLAVPQPTVPAQPSWVW